MSWVDKYRPQTLSECMGKTAAELQALIDSDKMTHLLLFGPPGTGKTTMAHAIANQLLGESKSTNFFEVNASDDRGIDMVRSTLVRYLRISPIDHRRKKVVLLDEADAITMPAQEALRRPIETYSENNIVIITANNVEKIHKAIQSRCISIEVRLSEADIISRLKFIAQSENVEIPEHVYTDLIKMYGYDLRNLTKMLELYSVTGNVTVPEFMPAWEALVAGDWKTASKLLKPEMMSYLFDYACRNLDAKTLIPMSVLFSTYDWRLSSFSTNPQIQLQSFAVQFGRIIKGEKPLFMESLI